MSATDPLREYRSWSFRDRSFQWALAVSVLWHAFWFFSLTIVISPPKRTERSRPKLVSIGPVLDDAIFRTLVQTRPQLSEAFYRAPSDLPALTEPKTRTLERHEPGDVVSVPFGKKFMDSMRDLVGGPKLAPEVDFSSAPLAYPGGGAVEEAARARQVLDRPPKPAPPLDASLHDASVEIDFGVDASGSVSSAEVSVTSGDPASDLVWLNYLKRWRFVSSPVGSPLQKIRARFRLDGSDEELS